MNTSAAPISTSPRVEGSTLYMSMNDGSVYSLNALTGKINWQYLVPNQATMSNPAVDNSSVYVGTWDGNRMSDLLAINKTSGALRWRIRISGANSWAMEPIAAGNRVYVYAGSYVNIYNATNGAFIKTIDIIYQLISGFAVDINDSIYYPASSPMVQ
jgi:outer membrane protein assembly factor BamB